MFIFDPLTYSNQLTTHTNQKWTWCYTVRIIGVSKTNIYKLIKILIGISYEFFIKLWIALRGHHKVENRLKWIRGTKLEKEFQNYGSSSLNTSLTVWTQHNSSSSYRNQAMHCTLYLYEHNYMWSSLWELKVNRE